MKRPMLVSGTAIGLSCAFLVLTGIAAAPILLLGAVSVFVLYFIKPLKLRNKIIIPTVCVSVFLSCICFTAFHLTKIEPAEKLDNVITNISGKIITTPKATPYGTNFTIKADAIGNHKHKAKINVYVPLGSEECLKLFDYVSLSDTKLKIVRNDYNKPDSSSMSDGVILETSCENVNFLWESEKTPYYYCLRFKEIVTKQTETYLNEYDSGFLLGMLFGDKDKLDSDITNDFRATGISHLLAVSGLHTSTWCLYLIIFLKTLQLKEKAYNTICLLFLCVFCVISAFTPSVLRASIMMAVFLFAPFFDEDADSLNSLGFALTVLVLSNPYIITSASFLLSFSATFGVLMSVHYSSKINKRISSIKNKTARKLLGFFSDNLMVSTFAGLFTLPVSAYFFGTFSLVAPITNILCVTVAFWGMLTGAVSTVISFIPADIVQLFSIALFKVTSLLLRIVTKAADTIAKFRFCSLPVHKEYFIAGIIITLFVLLITFAIFRSKLSIKLLKRSFFICALLVTLSILLPCTKLTPPTLSVLDVGDGVNIGVRSGLHYGFLNCGTTTDDTPHNSLPKATSEKLDYVYISKYDTKTNSLTSLLENLFPDTTVVTQYVKNCYRESGKEFCENTIITDKYNYLFNNEITIETVDTYGVKCAIIESTDKMVMACTGKQTDLNTVFKKHGTPDVLILSDYIPYSLPQKVDTLIISSDSEIILDERVTKLKNFCKNYFTTAENGNIKILM